MMVIGLTGGFGTGKSTVAGMLRKKGAAVLNADKAAHGLIGKNGACVKAVIKHFGKNIVTGDVVDRRKLAKVVFSDAAQLKKLTRIIHPAVIKEFGQAINDYRKGGKVKAVVMDVPLLFESGMNRLADVTMTVKTGRKEQLARAARRFKMTPAQANQRIKNQMPLSKKILLSDIIIDNRGSLRNTQKQVDVIWDKLKKRFN